MKKERYEELRRKGLEEESRRVTACYSPVPCKMGLAPGGRMQQEVYADPYGLDAWDQRHASRCFVTIANSAQWLAITGERPPTEPPTAAAYTEAGLPWFEYYGCDAAVLEGAETLAGVSSVGTMGKNKGETPLPENETAKPRHTVPLGRRRMGRVREMTNSVDRR